jgi:hypothetical protein
VSVCWSSQKTKKTKIEEKMKKKSELFFLSYLFLLVSQTSLCAEKPYFPPEAALHSASITRRSRAGIVFTSEK